MTGAVRAPQSVAHDDPELPLPGQADHPAQARKDRPCQADPKHLDSLYGEMKDAGLSAKTMRNHHAIISSALHQAVRWEWVRESGCRCSRGPGSPAGSTPDARGPHGCAPGRAVRPPLERRRLADLSPGGSRSVVVVPGGRAVTLGGGVNALCVDTFEIGGHA